MTFLEFEHFLDRFGGDFARWPASARAEAAILLPASAAARASLAAMREVEDLLTLSRQVPMMDATLVARATRGSQRRAARWSGLEIGWSAAAAAVLAAGILTGLSSPMHRDDDPAFTLAQALAPAEIVDVE